jgi:hypothetical protein
MLIDLRKLYAPLTADIRESLTTFASENAGIRICTVVLWGDGFHGKAWLHLDTPEHSAAWVEEWLKEGPGWVGGDPYGRFCNSCFEFAHHFGVYTFPEYPDFYEADDEEPAEYITLDGAKVVVEPDEGDAGKHRAIYPFLKAVLTELLPFPELRRVAPFRVGVVVGREWGEPWVLYDS